MSPNNYNSKTEALHELQQEMEGDKDLPLKNANLVFGEGNPNSEILFIGEAPGFYEDLQKRPFVGRSGQLLNAMIESLGWKREDIYITNIVKRRPPDNRDPLPEEIASYSPYLMRQVEIINPKIIATLGRFSMNFFMPTGKISRDQGKIFWLGDRLIMPLYHPAAALRSTTVKDDLKKSFVKLPIIKKKYEEFLKERMSDNNKGTNNEAEESTPKEQALF